MKKTSVFKSIVAALAASTLFACTQDMTDNLTVQTESDASVTKEQPKYRTYEEALAVAQDAIGLLGESSTTRSGKPRTVNTSDVQYILNSSATRSDGEPDTLMYVFNYEDSAGFAVVSANRATEELIAVTEQGNYVAGEETGNGGFDLYMDMAEEYVLTAAEPLPFLDGDQEVLTEFRMFVDRDTATIGPLVSVRWGQDWPYNSRCPVYLGEPTKAGCVATALAQIFTYYQYPASMIIHADNAMYEQELDWGSIIKHVYTEDPASTNCSQCFVSGYHYVIGDLIAQIGRYVDMCYGTGKSTAQCENVVDVFGQLGYLSDGFRDYNGTTVTNSLKNSRLVYMSGATANDEDGHAWVVDGYRHVFSLCRECVRPMNQLTWTELRRWTENDYYYHINWGWDGDNNGYFLVDVFNMCAGFDWDTPNNEGVSNYTTRLKMYANIRKR